MLKFFKAYALSALLALGLASITAPRASAQNEGRLTGSIVDFDGKPWADLPVKIKSDQGAITETKTDAAGKFQFNGLKNGKFTVTIQAPQMANPFEIVAEVHGADAAPLNVNFKEILEKQKIFKRPIVTEITPASEFYRAEEYHQQYFEKQGIKACHFPSSTT